MTINPGLGKTTQQTRLSFLNDKGSDDGLMTGMILIDLQKAFDTMT